MSEVTENVRRIRKLADSQRDHAVYEDNGTYSEALAAGIIANPQAHINALVAAGVLRRMPWSDACYEVVPPKPPHEHRWVVSDREQTRKRACGWVCADADCREETFTIAPKPDPS